MWILGQFVVCGWVRGYLQGYVGQLRSALYAYGCCVPVIQVVAPTTVEV